MGHWTSSAGARLMIDSLKEQGTRGWTQDDWRIGYKYDRSRGYSNFELNTAGDPALANLRQQESEWRLMGGITMVEREGHAEHA